MGGNGKTSQFAVASMALGIAGFPLIFCCQFSCVLCIAGIVCGHIGLNQIKRSEGRLNGWNICLAGLILSYSGLVISLLFIIAAGMIPKNYLYIKELGNQAN